MKRLKLLALTILVSSLGIQVTNAQFKIGVVDMNECFVNFYKTKEAEVKINEARNQAKSELDARLEKLNKAVEEINKLQQEINKPELSQSARETKTRELNEKANDTRALDREVAEFRSTRERQIQEQFLRMRKDLIDEIMSVVNEQIKNGGYDLVFDKSGLSMGQIPLILYSRKDMDFTPAVIAELNKNAPKKN
ncbi:MAG: OmpH family outer membrane protein [Chthoniobacterales bacterium]|nr:OmpH family outer membrane protein [Chthoniobacterales bacterium]